MRQPEILVVSGVSFAPKCSPKGTVLETPLEIKDIFQKTHKYYPSAFKFFLLLGYCPKEIILERRKKICKYKDALEVLIT